MLFLGPTSFSLQWPRSQSSSFTSYWKPSKHQDKLEPSDHPNRRSHQPLGVGQGSPGEDQALLVAWQALAGGWHVPATGMKGWRFQLRKWLDKLLGTHVRYRLEVKIQSNLQITKTTDQEVVPWPVGTRVIIESDSTLFTHLPWLRGV